MDVKLVFGLIVAVAFWMFSFYALSYLGHTTHREDFKAVEVAGQIGDRFGAVNALFSGVALCLIGISLLQTNRALENQQNEIESHRQSTIIVAYLNILERLACSNDHANRDLATLQLFELKDHIKKHLSKFVDSLPEFGEADKNLSRAIHSIQVLLAKIDTIPKAANGNVRILELAKEINSCHAFNQVFGKEVRTNVNLLFKMLNDQESGNVRELSPDQVAEITTQFSDECHYLSDALAKSWESKSRERANV